jgi:hypothetical protein
MRYILMGIAILAFFYLLCAFIAWRFNPGNWAEEGRMFAGVIGVVMSVGVPLRIYELENSKP